MLPFMKDNAERMATLDTYVQNGTLKPIIDSVFAFDKAKEAYERLMSNRAMGKVVVLVSGHAEQSEHVSSESAALS